MEVFVLNGVQKYKNPDYQTMVGIRFYVANCLFGDFSFDGKDGDVGLAFSLLLELDDAVTQSI